LFYKRGFADLTSSCKDKGFVSEEPFLKKGLDLSLVHFSKIQLFRRIVEILLLFLPL
jgi:hypothetical protein